MANPKTKSAVKINKQREVEKKKRKKRVIKLIITLSQFSSYYFLFKYIFENG